MAKKSDLKTLAFMINCQSNALIRRGIELAYRAIGGTDEMLDSIKAELEEEDGEEEKG